jgi:hypothetical protein
MRFIARVRIPCVTITVALLVMNVGCNKPLRAGKPAAQERREVGNTVEFKNAFNSEPL